MDIRDTIQKSKEAKIINEIVKDPLLRKSKTLFDILMPGVIENLRRELEAELETKIKKAAGEFQTALVAVQKQEGPQGPRGDSIVGPAGIKGKDADEVSIIDALLPKVIAKIPDPIEGPRGPKGDRGKAGNSIVGPQGPMGLPGERAQTPSMDSIIEALLKLPLGEGLTMKHIAGLEEALSKASKTTALRGGAGMKIKDSSTVTVTRNSDGTYSLTATGGGGSSPIVITGTIDDSNKSFSAPSQPTFLVINGSEYQSAGGAITWAYLAGNITLSQPVGSGGSIYGK